MKLTQEQIAIVKASRSGDDIVVEAKAGCLAPDTLIHVNRRGKSLTCTIEHIANQLLGQATIYRSDIKKMVKTRQWDLRFPTYVARAEDKVIKLGKLNDCWESGIKEIYEMVTLNGQRITASATHPFLTTEGDMVKLLDLQKGDMLQVNSYRGKNRQSTKHHYISLPTKFHPYQTQHGQNIFRIWFHRAVVEAHLNNIPLEEFLTIVRSEPEIASELIYLSEEEHIHHVDLNPENNRFDNLHVLTPEDHALLHAELGAANNVLWHVGHSQIKSIKLIGEENTYDIEMSTYPHNFLANDFVVHNSGKTSTLMKVAEKNPMRTGQYMAFNKSLVTDAAAKAPSNMKCRTIHSLAYGAIGNKYSERLRTSGRMRSADVARILDIHEITVKYGTEPRNLAKWFLASHVMKAVQNFCQSADQEITVKHFTWLDGIDEIDATTGKRSYTNNRILAEELIPFAEKFWKDVQIIKGGQLPFTHAHYLKMWQLNTPRIHCDFLLVDEAQDLSPIMADIAMRQECQKIFVGDSAQEIYGWMGAINALTKLEADHNLFLSQSWRFGQSIADIANVLLSELEDAERIGTVIGNPAIDSTIERMVDTRAVLTRTNAEAVLTVLQAQEKGLRPHLIGEGKEVASFAKAADELAATGRTSHPELACFKSWQDVIQYVAEDPQGSELKLLVKLVDTFGSEAIIKALSYMPSEDRSDMVVSTAHKSKGRQWGSVKLGGDFPVDRTEISDSELRLLYVAATRAEFKLDISMVGALYELMPEGMDY
jgi:hypothetical protein